MTITGIQYEDRYSVTVTDNGPGLSEQAMEDFKSKCKNGKYGLQNVDSRMRSIYGEKNGLFIETGKNGTSVTMNFLREHELNKYR